MTLLSTISLVACLLVLAAVPSASVALVVTRSATHGLRNGAAVALGIVAGDLVFVTLAILGMGVLAGTFGAFFAIIKWIAAGYLIWLGIGLLRARNGLDLGSARADRANLVVSFSSGLFLTLGDVKAIVFYASLFPTFLDMRQVNVVDWIIIVVATFFAVGGVKLGYALFAGRIMAHLRARRAQTVTRVVAGILMIGAGVYLIATA